MKKTLGAPRCPHDEGRPLLVWASLFIAFGKQTRREGVLAPNCSFSPSPAAAHGDPGSLSLWPLVLFFLVHGRHGGQEKGLFVPLESLQPGIDLMSGRPLPPPPPGPPEPRSRGQEPDSQVPPAKSSPAHNSSQTSLGPFPQKVNNRGGTWFWPLRILAIPMVHLCCHVPSVSLWIDVFNLSWC